MIEQVFTDEGLAIELAPEALAQTHDGLALDLDQDLLDLSSDQVDAELKNNLLHSLFVGLDEAEAIALQVFYGRLFLAKALEFKSAFEAKRH